MSNYPIFPLTPDWGNNTSVQTDVNKSQYGSGGVVERGSKGLNPVSQNKSITVNTSNFTIVDEFIKDNFRYPVRLRSDGGITDDGKLYKLLNYNWTYLSPNVRTFSGEFMQVRRAGFIIEINALLTEDGFTISNEQDENIISG